MLAVSVRLSVLVLQTNALINGSSGFPGDTCTAFMMSWKRKSEASDDLQKVTANVQRKVATNAPNS